ncbi:MAG: hypothetical protein WCP20_02485 [Desulfuromonadales bacterium]
MKKIISVSPLEGKKVAVVFSDGISGVFDVAPYIRSEFFKRLEDDAYFRQVRLFFFPVSAGRMGRILVPIPLKLIYRRLDTFEKYVQNQPESNKGFASQRYA